MDPLQFQMLLRELQEKGVNSESFSDQNRKVGQPPPLTSKLLNPPQSSEKSLWDQIFNEPIPLSGYGPKPPASIPAPTQAVNTPESSLGATMMAGQYPVEMGMAEVNPPVEAPQMPTPALYEPMDAGLASVVSDYDGPSMTPTTTGPSNPPNGGGGGELPYQTYERLTGQKWTGGRSKSIQDILSRLGITAMPGSPEANMALQKALMRNAENIQ